MQLIDGGITAPQKFVAAGVKAGIKQSGKEDVAIIFSEVPAAAAALFTQNTMAAAPVQVSREVAALGKARAFIVNSGCANACTGQQGLQDARQMARIGAEALKIAENEVIIASTGIIGVNLPMEKLAKGINQAAVSLSGEGYEDATLAIMTTDTFQKTCAYEFSLGGKQIRIGGIAKGAGMIHPNMATMLCFITTDIEITPAVLKKALTDAVKVSFNMITVDGDTSTNDMIAILANGAAGNDCIDSIDHPDYPVFAENLKTVATYLAQQVVRDGEGATKFLEIKVSGAKDFADAKTAAMSIAKSPLVKTAFFGEDPNWGRILCAAGYSGAMADPKQTSLSIGGVKIVEGGLGAQYDEQKLRKIMSEHDIQVLVDLGVGSAEATVWTCDFSYEYVKINGEYHT